MKSLVLSLLVAAACIGALAAFDHTQAAADVASASTAPPDIDPTSTAGQAFTAFKAGKYIGGVCLLVILAVWGVRKYGGAWFKTDRGGSVLAILVGQATAFGTAAAAGALNAGSIVDAVIAGLVLAAAGSGARHLTKNGVAPPDKA